MNSPQQKGVKVDLEVQEPNNMKNRFIAAFFAFVFGTFGINNFYTGRTSTGVIDCVISVILSWTIIVPVVVTIINTVRGCQYLWCNSDEEFCQKYVK